MNPLEIENIMLIEENKELTNVVIKQAAEMMKLVNMLSKPVMVLRHNSYMASAYQRDASGEHIEPQDKKAKALEKELARNMKLWDEVYDAQLLKIGNLQKERDRIKTELLTLQSKSEKELADLHSKHKELTAKYDTLVGRYSRILYIVGNK